ncbi:Crp/Fnr family transcriptional regulator [Pseudoroseicyclus sp. CXY001]|uniref:Crp/Fnr family transcriptional regulator n=1 Tax=Pseudoroseicyclus sp. CXY001 TaxID=3242492 RepID=UPI003570ACB1
MLEETLAKGLVGTLPRRMRAKLAEIAGDTVEIGSRQSLAQEGDAQTESILLLDGLMGRYMGPRERRQMVAIQVPGDFVDLHALPLDKLDHEVESLGPVRIARFPHDALRAAMAGDYPFAEALWKLTLIDAGLHRYWSYRLGRFRALAGMANFFAEMDHRLGRAGLRTEEGFALPLTHADLSDICGISQVHVSRVLKDLREAGLCALQGGRLTIHDRAGLYRMGEVSGAGLEELLD